MFHIYSLAKKPKWGTWNSDKHESQKKIEDNFDGDARNPLLYVERACEVGVYC